MFAVPMTRSSVRRRSTPSFEPSLSPSLARLGRHQLNLTLWVLQWWLALFYLGAGYAALTEPVENLVILMTWPGLVPLEAVRVAGGVQIALSILILAPLASWRFGRSGMRIAAVSLFGVALMALIFHGMRLDIGLAVTNLLLVGMAATVIRLRWSWSPHP